MFLDREQGGRQLAAKLDRYRLQSPVVLGIARGGIPVAFEVARFLGAPLEPLAVRRIALPGCAGVAAGAVAEGGIAFLSPDALLVSPTAEPDAVEAAARAAEELEHDVAAWRGRRPPPDLVGRTVLLVDDGVASGASARAAARAVRRWGAVRVVLAAPVVAAARASGLREEVDDLVAVELPLDCLAVAPWYDRFPSLSDEDVASYLARARRQSRGRDEAPPSDAAADGGEHLVEVPVEGSRTLDAALAAPEDARGLAVIVGGGAAAHGHPRDAAVADRLRRGGFATLRPRLLTAAEADEDAGSGRYGVDVGLLGRRLELVTRWAATASPARGLPLGYFGVGAGAAAALAAAAEFQPVAAVVSCGGRVDLVERATLARVRAPVLVVVGTAGGGPRAAEKDERALAIGRAALDALPDARLAVVRGATHRMSEPGSFALVARLTAEWFQAHLVPTESRNPADASDRREGRSGDREALSLSARTRRRRRGEREG
jgi:putative phosphoribosyl transferase